MFRELKEMADIIVPQLVCNLLVVFVLRLSGRWLFACFPHKVFVYEVAWAAPMFVLRLV